MRHRCAAYARYSDDRQSPASIQDQLRICREYARERGWEFLEEHVYVDRALSGAGTDRPAFMQLNTALSSSPPPFEVLLLDDTSRIGRNLSDTARFYENAKFRGFQVIAISQQIDSDCEQAETLMTVHGLVDSLYIKELGKKTHRGLVGKAIQGFHTGGRCFGYDNVKAGDSVRLQINESEAAVVRRIFEMSADGSSLKSIARVLNGEQVPSPRPRSRKKYATWCPTAIREMLRREVYSGTIVWNRSRFVKEPGTNKRVKRLRPESEWQVVPKPELRIINEVL